MYQRIKPFLGLLAAAGFTAFPSAAASMLYSPFGWPYYSPVVVYSAPGFRYGYGRSFGRGFVGRGFASGVPAFHSGGFAARGVGGGGFHHR